MDPSRTRAVERPAPADPEPSGPGYQVAPAALAETARGVEGVLDELRSLGVGVGLAEAGRGVLALADHAGPAGHAALAEAFTEFCARWEWGVRALVRAGREVVAGLDAAAAAYSGVDLDQSSRFGAILAGAVGESAAPDRSWAETGRAAAARWTAAVRDAGANSGPAVLAHALGGGNPIDGLADDLAGLNEIGQ